MTYTANHWTLDDIDWQAFVPGAAPVELVEVVKTAALVERNGADYADYLSHVFADDPDFAEKARIWAKEEIQHGEALGRWAELADPDWSLETASRIFRDRYQIDTDVSQSVRGSRGRELVARCVVETGTSSFYSAIRDFTDEPVLRQICARIAADEFMHYRLFYAHMHTYLRAEGVGIIGRLRTVLGRFAEMDDDELARAYHSANMPDAPYDIKAANAAYGARAFALYEEKHVRRAAFMMCDVSGLNPRGWLSRQMSRLLWHVLKDRSSNIRAVFAAP